MSSGLFEVVNGVDAAILVAAKDGVLLVWVGIPELKQEQRLMLGCVNNLSPV